MNKKPHQNTTSSATILIPYLPNCSPYSLFTEPSRFQKQDPGTPEDNAGDDSDPMSEDDASDTSDDGDNDGDNLDDDAVSSTKVAGVPLAAAQAAAGEASKSGTSAHNFMPTIEVELQMQQLWKHEAETLDLIFASGKKQRRHLFPGASAAGDGVGVSPAFSNGGGLDAAGSTGGIYDGYRMFFVRALAVPPPRFRPPMNMGDMIAEHPQNVYLTKVGAELREGMCFSVCSLRQIHKVP